MKKIYINILIIFSILLLFTGCSAKQKETSNITQGPQSQEGRPKFQKPDLYGKVSKIIGNEVTLQLSEMPKQERSNKDVTKEEREKMKQEMQNMSPEQRAKKMEESLKLTGETKSVVIPVGVPISSFKQGVETELDLGDIYNGLIIQVWLDEDNTAKSVRVMQGR